MKTKEEIQRVHDMLVAVSVGDINIGLSQMTIELITQTTHVLCWALDHEHHGAPAFTELINLVEERARECGYVLEDHSN